MPPQCRFPVSLQNLEQLRYHPLLGAEISCTIPVSRKVLAKSSKDSFSDTALEKGDNTELSGSNESATRSTMFLVKKSCLHSLEISVLIISRTTWHSRVSALLQIITLIIYLNKYFVNNKISYLINYHCLICLFHSLIDCKYLLSEDIRRF